MALQMRRWGKCPKLRGEGKTGVNVLNGKERDIKLVLSCSHSALEAGCSTGNIPHSDALCCPSIEAAHDGEWNWLFSLCRVSGDGPFSQ